MSTILPHITLESGKQPQHSIIWLHGLGADGQDFVPVADELELPVAIRYLFPHAPQRPVTINGGFVMRAWYDIARANIGALQDEAGIRASQALIEALIAQHTALRQSAPLGGVLALSTYLPLAETVAHEAQASSRTTPIFMAHGRNDTVVPYASGAASRDALLKLGYTVQWQEYAMPHSVCEAELRDIETWLGRKLLKA